MTTPLEIGQTAQRLTILPWNDEVVDAVGFDPRSQYVELFWLNVLGPTATWLLRRMVSGLDAEPAGYELDLPETANALGLTYGPGASNPFTRALHRCVLFGAARPLRIDALAVRRRLPPVATRHLQRMPDRLRQIHESWKRATLTASQLERAQVLARAMVAVGDDPDVVERQLLGLGVPPRAAIDATRDALAAAS
jgi:hypothetical protein